MSPLDDELRAALHRRAQAVTPSPDPMAGIERRARKIQRNRIGAAVAASALAVSAVVLAVPALQSATSSAPEVTRYAPSAPSSSPTPEPTTSPYVLDPRKPWSYRGNPDVAVEGDLDAYTIEWATRHGVLIDDVELVPLFGQRYEPADVHELVYLVTQTSTGEHWWGVAQATDSGPELLVDERLAPSPRALAAAVAGDEVPRLMVLASPEVGNIEYRADGSRQWSQMHQNAPGVATTPLEGDPATDSYRVLDPSGTTIIESAAPDPPGASPAPDGEVPAGEPEGPGTDTPIDVDPAPYALDLDDPWAFRGPTELTLHPALADTDARLFAEGDTGRDDGTWSQRPLLAIEDASTGLSVLMVGHRNATEAFVTTTWQTQDEAPRHSEQAVRDGQLLVQSFLPDVGPAGVLLALASPLTGAVETDLAPRQSVGVTRGVGIFELPADPSPGQVLLYTEGDGLLYHVEPARRS